MNEVTRILERVARGGVTQGRARVTAAGLRRDAPNWRPQEVAREPDRENRAADGAGPRGVFAPGRRRRGGRPGREGSKHFFAAAAKAIGSIHDSRGARERPTQAATEKSRTASKSRKKIRHRPKVAAPEVAEELLAWDRPDRKASEANPPVADVGEDALFLKGLMIRECGRR